MIRTLEDIEAEIQAVKAANVNWITDPGDKALITSLNSNLAALRSEYSRSRASGDTFS